MIVETGTWTPLYDSGTYTGGFTTVTGYYTRIGNVVQIVMTGTLAETPDGNHSYSIYKGIPGNIMNVGLLGNARIQNSGKNLSSPRSVTIPSSLSGIAISWTLCDGSGFPTSGQNFDITMTYITKS